MQETNYDCIIVFNMLSYMVTSVKIKNQSGEGEPNRIYSKKKK